jgi:hypothetical protein
MGHHDTEICTPEWLPGDSDAQSLADRATAIRSRLSRYRADGPLSLDHGVSHPPPRSGHIRPHLAKADGLRWVKRTNVRRHRVQEEPGTRFLEAARRVVDRRASD